jgi:phosphoglycolate phosphatase
MVGDHRNDVLAAAGLGIPCIFAGWGYGTTDMAQGAAIAASFADVPALAETLLRHRLARV